MSLNQVAYQCLIKMKLLEQAPSCQLFLSALTFPFADLTPALSFVLRLTSTVYHDWQRPFRSTSKVKATEETVRCPDALFFTGVRVQWRRTLRRAINQIGKQPSFGTYRLQGWDRENPVCWRWSLVRFLRSWFWATQAFLLYLMLTDRSCCGSNTLAFRARPIFNIACGVDVRRSWSSRGRKNWERPSLNCKPLYKAMPKIEKGRQNWFKFSVFQKEEYLNGIYCISSLEFKHWADCNVRDRRSSFLLTTWEFGMLCGCVRLPSNNQFLLLYFQLCSTGVISFQHKHILYHFSIKTASKLVHFLFLRLWRNLKDCLEILFILKENVKIRRPKQPNVLRH